MSRYVSHPQSVRRLPAGRYYYVPAATLQPPTVVERRMPTLLGVSAASYLASVCLASSASEAVSWIPQVIAIGATIVWFCVGVIVQGQRIRWCRPVTLYNCYFLWGITGVAVTTNIEYFLSIFQTYAKVALITWVMLQSTRTRKDVLVCCLAIAMASIVVAVLGRGEIAKALAVKAEDSAVKFRASGTLLSNSNTLGMFAAVVVMCSGFCILGYRSLFVKILSCVCLVCGLYLVAASGSRSSMLGVAGSVVALYLCHFRKAGRGAMGKKVLILLLALGLFAGTGLFLAKLPFFFRLVEGFSSVDAIMKEPRVQYFFRAVEVFVQNPITGLGWGGFALAGLGKTAKGIGHYSHSSFSEVMVATGLPGFILYFSGVYSLAMWLRRLRKSNLPKQDATAVNVIYSIVWVLILWHFVSNVDDNRLIWPLLGVFCGYLWNLDRQYGGNATSLPRKA